MKLSIITINYNNCEGLRRTIDSVINQTWQEFEWIIVDGGSTDGSRELIEKTAKNCSLVSYWCSEKDQGPYDAMNKGCKLAHGNYVHYLNSGDVYADTRVLFSFIHSLLDADIIYGDVFWGSKRAVRRYDDKLEFAFLRKDALCHQAMFIKRKVQQEFLYDIKYRICADRKFGMQCFLCNKTFVHLNIPIAVYELTGLSSNNVKDMLHEHEAINKELIPECILNELLELDERKKEEREYPQILTTRRLLNEHWINLPLINKYLKFVNFINYFLPLKK